MFRLARNHIQQRLSKLEEHRDDTHLEEQAGLAERWEDESLNFYQPDEALRVEDLLKDGASFNPEQLLQRDEVEEQIHRAIANLPRHLRESFVLFALEGFTSDEVAMMTGSEPRQILEQVEEARERLRRELTH
jgi:RNA polymerase sigma factor (sigma-70 family)